MRKCAQVCNVNLQASFKSLEASLTSSVNVLPTFNKGRHLILSVAKIAYFGPAECLLITSKPNNAADITTRIYSVSASNGRPLHGSLLHSVAEHGDF